MKCKTLPNTATKKDRQNAHKVKMIRKQALNKRATIGFQPVYTKKQIEAAKEAQKEAARAEG